MSGKNKKRAVCRRCDKGFYYEPIFALNRECFPRVYCAPCIVLEERDYARKKAAENEQALERRWRSICPPLYRATNPEHRNMNQKILRGLLNWIPTDDGIGLGIFGETGRCKTRMSFLILKRLLYEGYHVDAVSTAKFALHCGNLFDDIGEVKRTARRRLHAFQSTEVLFLDDLGKGPLTPRVESEFFDLIETRTAHLRPTIWTANATSDDLARIMSKDRGGPIIRRLREHSRLIPV